MKQGGEFWVVAADIPAHGHDRPLLNSLVFSPREYKSNTNKKGDGRLGIKSKGQGNKPDQRLIQAIMPDSCLGHSFQKSERGKNPK